MCNVHIWGLERGHFNGNNSRVQSQESSGAYNLYKRLKISIRLILCNCCRDIELHWRGQGWATSVEGKGRESAAHRDTHSLPAQASTSILSRKEILILGIPRCAHAQMWTDAKKCGAAGGVWKIAERVTVNAKYTTRLLHQLIYPAWLNILTHLVNQPFRSWGQPLRLALHGQMFPKCWHCHKLRNTIWESRKTPPVIL